VVKQNCYSFSVKTGRIKIR